MKVIKVSDLGKFGGSQRLINALSEAGLSELYPPQALSLQTGLLSGSDSIVVAAPTASGKTLIAEMAALKAFFERRGKIIYLVPLRALAREKYEDLTNKYREMRVTMSTGDFDSPEPRLQGADLIIATNERMDSLIRHRAAWLKEVSLVIADEIHLLGDPRRGPTLEIVLTRLKSARTRLRFIALSATIPNAKDLASWLGAKLVESDWRPVPLREGVFFNGAVIFSDGLVRWTPERSGTDEVDLAMETVEEGGQALIFVNTRRAAESVARKVSGHLGLSAEQAGDLAALSERVLGVSPEPTRLCKKLAECVRDGAAFHHAGINYSQRKLVEDAFRANRIKIIAATTTLAMGLNLPSRRVVIRDWYRYESGFGMRPIPAIEIKQMSGRAGRPGFDDHGEAVIVARNHRDEKYLFERYIKGRPEDIDSQIASEYALRTHVLSSIAGLFARSRNELMDFLNDTFFALQSGTGYLSPVADGILEFLESEGMIIKSDRTLAATRFGRRVSELYIDPASAVILRDALSLRTGKTGPFALLHMISRTPDMMRLSLKKKDLDEMLDIFSVHAPELLLPEDERHPSEEMLSELKTASALMQWILEAPEDKITGHFGIGPGDLHTLVELSDWLIYSASELSKVFGLREARKDIASLRPRVLYGIKEELLELVSLKGVGRVRARNLYDAGFRGLADIRESGVKELSGVPSIGKAIAEDIMKQAARPERGKKRGV